MSLDAPLPTFRLGRGVALAQAIPWSGTPVTLDSPALSVMTDLTQVKAATTHPSTTLRQAEQMMIYQGVRMLFVVTDMPQVEGLVTDNDLHGDRQMRVVHERGTRYDEVTVADVMTELAMLDALDLERVRTAAVGNAVATLKRLGRNHLLVVERRRRLAPHPRRRLALADRAPARHLDRDHAGGEQLRRDRARAGLRSATSRRTKLWKGAEPGSLVCMAPRPTDCPAKS